MGKTSILKHLLKRGSPHKLKKKFNVGEGRYHITTLTRELSPVVRGVGMALGGEEESARQGVNVQ